MSDRERDQVAAPDSSAPTQSDSPPFAADGVGKSNPDEPTTGGQPRRWLVAPVNPASDTVGTGSGIALSCTILSVLAVALGLTVWALLRAL